MRVVKEGRESVKLFERGGVCSVQKTEGQWCCEERGIFLKRTLSVLAGGIKRGAFPESESAPVLD